MEKLFSVVPEAVLCHPKLNGNAVKIYCFLSMYADEQSWCWPSLRRLQTDSRVSRSTVKRSLRSLEAEGFITRELLDGRLIYVLDREAFNRDDNTVPLN